jgi:hypothetical protein
MPRQDLVFAGTLGINGMADYRAFVPYWKFLLAGQLKLPSAQRKAIAK